MLFDTRQEPEKLRYTIEHTSDWVCEEIEPYGGIISDIRSNNKYFLLNNFPSVYFLRRPDMVFRRYF